VTNRTVLLGTKTQAFNCRFPARPFLISGESAPQRYISLACYFVVSLSLKPLIATGSTATNSRFAMQQYYKPTCPTSDPKLKTPWPESASELYRPSDLPCRRS
jgi:hypothetical protein